MLFDGGSASKVIASSGSADTDWANFAWDKTSGLMVAFYAGATGGTRQKTSVSNVSVYSKSGNDAATQDATGYSLVLASFLFGIDRVQTNGF